MRLIRGLHNLREPHRGSCLTIGNFDGVHIGHQALLERLTKRARELDRHTSLMTFEPLPHEYFEKHEPRSRLSSFRDKITALSALPDHLRPDHCLILNFDATLAVMPAREFIERVLIDTCAISAIMIGDDFRFGSDRLGDLALLESYAESGAFEVSSMDTHTAAGERVSSTRIRELLIESDFASVAHLLGRPYGMHGRVCHGDKRGRSIGFPTANIQLDRIKSPINGVYSVTMHSDKYGDLPGIANVGRRPTVAGTEDRIEVHIFDFSSDIYGEYFEIRFHHKIRDEKRFDSFEQLREQIEKDCEQAREQLL